MPAVSVIIPVYNRPQKYLRALHSVLSQTFTDFELIVIDDGSKPPLPSPIHLDPRIVFLPIRHGGVSAARNRGIAVSTSPLVAFLDSDDEWMPTLLEKELSFLNRYPGAQIVQCEDIWIRDGVRVNQGAKHQKQEGDIFDISLERCMIAPSCVILRRALFEKYGVFDESLPACEDYDLWLRICAFEKVGLVRERLLIRHGGDTDQLSKKYPIMDLFRIKTLEKLLKIVEIPNYRKKQIYEILTRKLIILKNGAKKRKKIFLWMKLLLVQKRLSVYNTVLNKEFL